MRAGITMTKGRIAFLIVMGIILLIVGYLVYASATCMQFKNCF